MDCCVVIKILECRDLHQEFEADGTLNDALHDFFKVVVGREGGNLRVGQKVVSQLRHNAIAAGFRLSSVIGEPERGDTEIGVAGEA